MPDLADFGNSLDGEFFSPDSPGYEAIRRPVNLAYREVCPRLVVRCRSVADVVSAVTYAKATGTVSPLGAGGTASRAARRRTGSCSTCLASMASPSQLTGSPRSKRRPPGTGVQGAACLRPDPASRVRSTIGITGLTLGGGIGLLGRKQGLTCDRLVGAQVVLPDGSVVDCAHDREPDLFWGLRGAGGGQFGVVLVTYPRHWLRAGLRHRRGGRRLCRLTRRQPPLKEYIHA